ncbi:hypothetical protein HHL16_14205 [Pseudoflavitalea sp. G-6-1-2]|uniref:DUF6807 domain-containing protein n=1 Tax=Pseudoflavitalea sp. G-6-1-2 TaxID=2728841 RepID=UPI00146B4DB6|nr:PmoA family protein [Pseudoflavitalea sp. G-6-1-2]NML22035.1 hypothetical protein [Pseudoflavitalea sp. G-6-1-2]
MKKIAVAVTSALIMLNMQAHAQQPVKLIKRTNQNKIDILIGGKFFTSFLYPDTLEKPVLFPVHAANGTMVTRGFPIIPQPGDPTDHPHHLGIWFNFENVNGLDFWNNSYAIAAAKKSHYGWIRTTGTPVTKNGQTGTLQYQANWTNQQKDVLLKEATTLRFSGTEDVRIIDRETELTAVTDVNFKDAKDGMLGFRMAHALQIPELKDKEYKDDKGIVTTIKGKTDSIANGNYLTSEGKQGNDAWGTRGSWCKLYGKMGNDSVTVLIMDHPENINYPTWWHARGYGLFAANPIGGSIFTKGQITTDKTLKPGEQLRFRYRIIVQNGKETLSTQAIEKLAKEFTRQ